MQICHAWITVTGNHFASQHESHFMSDSCLAKRHASFTGGVVSPVAEHGYTQHHWPSCLHPSAFAIAGHWCSKL